MTDKGASGAATVVAENLYLRIGKTLSVKERSGPLAQGKGRRAQGKIVIWVVLLPAPSSLLSAFKLPFSFNVNKHKNMHYQNCSLYLPIVAFFLTLNYLLPIFSNNPAFVFCLR